MAKRTLYITRDWFRIPFKTASKYSNLTFLSYCYHYAFIPVFDVFQGTYLN